MSVLRRKQEVEKNNTIKSPTSPTIKPNRTKLRMKQSLGGIIRKRFNKQQNLQDSFKNSFSKKDSVNSSRVIPEDLPSPVALSPTLNRRPFDNSFHFKSSLNIEVKKKIHASESISPQPKRSPTLGVPGFGKFMAFINHAARKYSDHEAILKPTLERDNSTYESPKKVQLGFMKIKPEIQPMLEDRETNARKRVFRIYQGMLTNTNKSKSKKDPPRVIATDCPSRNISSDLKRPFLLDDSSDHSRALDRKQSLSDLEKKGISREIQVPAVGKFLKSPIMPRNEEHFINDVVKFGAELKKTSLTKFLLHRHSASAVTKMFTSTTNIGQVDR